MSKQSEANGGEVDLLGDRMAAAAPPRTAPSTGEQAAPRVHGPNRAQLELRAMDLESLLSEDHRARLVWRYVVGVQLRARAIRR